MGVLTRFFYKHLILLLCFLAPVTVMVIIYIRFGMAPFGDTSLLIMDLSNQYVEFFAGLRQLAAGNSTVFFSWSNGLGGSNIGLFAYYLSSPLSFLTLLFPQHQLPFALMLLTLLKIGLSGLTFGIFLQSHFRRSDLSTVWFSLLYGVMSYSVVYSLCVMWLDGVIWLPMVILGVDKLFEENNPFLLTMSLTAVFLSTYYLSYMIGLFCAIYFLYRYFVSFYHQPLWFFARRFALFIGSAVTAACLNAWLLVPTVFSMMQGKIGGSNFTPRSPFNFSFPDLLYKLFIGNGDSIMNDGLPSIFCGTAILVLIVQFYFSRAIGFREKLVSSLVLGFLAVSFYSQKLDIAWHLFQHPNWFPFRYAFVFSFFCLLIAYHAYICTEEVPSWLPIATVMGIAAFSAAALHADLPYLSKGHIIFTVLMASIYAILLMHPDILTDYRRPLLISLILLSALEMSVNGQALLKGLDRDHRYVPLEEYLSFTKNVAPLVYRTQAADPQFYRMENLDPRTKNDAIGFGYNGVAHFSSTYNREVNRLLKDLGFVQTYINTTYMGDTLITESLLGVKYLMAKSAHIPDHSWRSSQGIYNLHENPYALGIGFAADDLSTNVDFHKHNSLTYQAELLEAMGSAEQKLLFPIKEYSLTTQNILKQDKKGFTRYEKEVPDQEAAITYTLTAPGSGPVYAALPTASNNGAAMYLNGAYKGTFFTSGTKRVLSLGTYEAGAHIHLKFRLNQERLDIDEAYFAQLDRAAFQRLVTRLKQRELIIGDYGPGRIRGEITADGNQFLFTSIPYDESWKVTVDGQAVKPFSFQNALLAVPLSKGTHLIDMRYRPKGLGTGLTISACTALMMILFWIRHSSITGRFALLAPHHTEEASS